MRRIFFSIGNFHIYGYGFMIAVGFLVAVIIGTYRAKRRGIKSDNIIDIAIWAVIFGAIGSKLLYILVNSKEFFASPLSVLGSSGFVIYGGIIAGAITAVVYCRIKKLDFMEYFDLIMPEVVIAQGFGRIGCLMAGCCYGRETSSFLGIVFPQGGLAPAGVRLIPTQLISAVGDFLIAAVLIILANRFSKPKTDKSFGQRGDIGAMYLILYGAGRFAVEFLRNDHRGTVGFLSTSQFISLFIVAIGVAIMIAVRRRAKALPAGQTAEEAAEPDGEADSEPEDKTVDEPAEVPSREEADAADDEPEQV